MGHFGNVRSLLSSFAIFALLSALGCRCGTERIRCERDLNCAASEVCFVDGQCLDRGVAARLDPKVGNECVVQAGAEIGCEADVICRMGNCVIPGPTTTDAGTDPTDGGPSLACEGTPDDFVPLFGGASEAIADGEDAVIVRWFPAADETPPEAIEYLVYRSTSEADIESGPPVRTVVGGTSVRFDGLITDTTYYFLVRARDAGGQVDCNVAVVSATPTAAPDCVEYDLHVQPIFDAMCTRCHGGDDPRRELRLEDYDGVLAGGLTGSEVIACQPDSSLLFMKISQDTPPIGDRMPQDGPPYLANAQADLIQKWIAEGARRSCADPNPCDDQIPPTFAGLTSAETLSDGFSARLCWAEATDDSTAPGAIFYDIYEATFTGGQDFAAPPRTTSDAGAMCSDVAGLTPGQEYCWVVRARDAAGNRDDNTVEQCLTMPAAACIDYQAIIQPIFDANCVRCHDGPDAPRDLHLTSHAGVLAGGLTGNEVVACRPEESLLWQKTVLDPPPIGDRMPKDGPPYLTNSQIAAMTQWIEEGARESCQQIDPCSDAVAPAFAGLTQSTPLDATRVELCWSAGSDNLTPTAALVYDVYDASGPGGQDFSARPRKTSAPGATCVTIDALSPTQQYCFVVRARDQAGNRDANTVERCETMGPIPTCVDYASMVQPLFDYNCTRCHSGSAPPQWLQLDSYPRAIAGSVRRNEIIGCAPGASLLLQKIGQSPPLGARMPFDGPPYLTGAQQTLLSQWVGNGARASCAEPTACTDSSPPAFGGATSAIALDPTTIRVCWSEGADDSTPPAAIRYDIFESAAPGAQSFNEPAQHSIVGESCYDVRAGPLTSLCFVVRAVDRNGNGDNNTVQHCAGTMGSSCGIEFGDLVQPILSARCTHCHSGADAPRALDLSSHGGVMAGGVLRQEAPACDWSGSMLGRKTIGNACGERMPFDGPPWIAPSERSILQRWVEAGSRRSCSDPTPCADSTPPTFGGASSAVALDPTTVEVSWSPASDAVTPAAAIAYDVYDSTTTSGFGLTAPAPYSISSGATSIEIRVPPGARACFVVRARDARGNHDANTTARCVTPPGACVEYQELVQPIFDTRCVQCHSGSGAPRGIRWDSYANAASNADEVGACDVDASDLLDEVDDCRMPRDTTELCNINACLPTLQRQILRNWVASGASPSCPAGGC